MMTLVSMMPAVALTAVMTNCFYTNLSSAVFDAAKTFMIAHGPKYAAVFQPPSLDAGMTDYDMFSRRIYCYDFFHQQDKNADDGTPAKFRLKNPGWHPMDQDYVPSPGVEEYVCETRAVVQKAFEDSIKLHKIRPPRNLSKKHRDALRRLRLRTDVVFIDTDKGLGIVVLDADDYEARVLAELSTTHHLQTSADEDPSLATRAELREKLLPLIGTLP